MQVQRRNGKEYVRVRREDWEALMRVVERFLEVVERLEELERGGVGGSA